MDQNLHLDMQERLLSSISSICFHIIPVKNLQYFEFPSFIIKVSIGQIPFAFTDLKSLKNVKIKIKNIKWNILTILEFFFINRIWIVFLEILLFFFYSMSWLVINIRLIHLRFIHVLWSSLSHVTLICISCNVNHLFLLVFIFSHFTFDLTYWFSFSIYFRIIIDFTFVLWILFILIYFLLNFKWCFILLSPIFALLTMIFDLSTVGILFLIFIIVIHLVFVVLFFSRMLSLDLFILLIINIIKPKFLTLSIMTAFFSLFLLLIIIPFCLPLVPIVLSGIHFVFFVIVFMAVCTLPFSWVILVTIIIILLIIRIPWLSYPVILGWVFKTFIFLRILCLIKFTLILNLFLILV